MPNIANKFILPDGTEINFENGIPEGGTPGQVLTKQSDNNRDVSWQNPSVSDEQVTTAVNSYLEENPVSGMTAEQEQQLNQNTADVADLKSALEQKGLPAGGTTGQVLAKKTDNDYDVEWKDEKTGTGLSAEAIDKLEEVGNYLVYTTADGGSKWMELISILRNSSSGGDSGETVTLQSISATYTGGEVAVGTFLDSLTGITVTAHYSDGSTANVTGYILSGTIVEGENTITVSYKGKTTTFKVNGVNESPSGIELMSEKNIVANNYSITKNAKYKFYQLSNKENCNVYEIPVYEGITYIASLTNNNQYGMPYWDTNQLNKVNSNDSFSISANKFTKFDTEKRVTVDLDGNTILNTELASATIDNKDGTYTRSIEFTPAITGYLYTDNRTSNTIYSIKRK